MSNRNNLRPPSACAAIVATLFAFVSTGSLAETVLSVTQTSYNYRDKPVCKAVRQNPATYASIVVTNGVSSVNACNPLAESATYGPDRVTQNVYNSAGQLTEIKEAVGTPIVRSYAVYTYTDNGLKKTEKDAHNNLTTLEYDGFDRLASIRYPLKTIGSNASSPRDSTGDYEDFEYDANGNRTRWRRRDGSDIIDCYDNLNRIYAHFVHSESNCAATGGAKDVYTNYDGLGRLTSKRFVSPTGHGIVYNFDGLGRVSSVIRTVNGSFPSQSVSYLYNAAGARTRLTYPSGRYVTYTHDYTNRVTKTMLEGLPGSATRLLYSIGYDNVGNRRKLARVNHAHPNEDPTTCVSGIDITCYGYDAVGRLAYLANDFNTNGYDIRWSFAYNPAGEVFTLNSTDFSGLSRDTYEIDEMQNEIQPIQTHNGLNQVQSLITAGKDYCVGEKVYDNRANLICDTSADTDLIPGVGTRVFTYDLENRLLTATYPEINGATTATLEYDPEGRLVKYQYQKPLASAVTTYFLYDGTELIGEYSETGTMKWETYFGPGTDEPLIGYDGTNYRLYWANYQGSITGITGEGGNMSTASLYKYSPYGEPRNNGNAEDWSGSRFRYTGQVALPEIELYHYKARAYDPRLGRFLQTDPIGSEDDINLYAYVAGDPVNATDPTGTEGTKTCADDFAGPLCFGSNGSSIDKTAFGEGALTEVASQNTGALKLMFGPVGEAYGQFQESVVAGLVGEPEGANEAQSRSLGSRVAFAAFLIAPGSKGSVAQKVGLTVEEAGAKIASQIGKNRVSVMSGSGRWSIDLAGKAHFDKASGKLIPTPHVKFQKLTFGNGKSSLSPGKTEAATMNDIRTVKRLLGIK